MLSIKNLEQNGVDIRSAMDKCGGDEAFYLHLVELFLKKNDYLKIRKALNQKDLEKAYQCALNMKGVSGNLSLTPIFLLSSELTRHLYNKENIDYSPYMDNIGKILKKLKSL